MSKINQNAKKILFLGFTVILGTLSINPIAATANADYSLTQNKKQSGKPSVEYRCIERNGTPTTVAYTSRGPIELIVWKSEYFSGSGYTPENRCLEVTSRFQKHSDAKNLRYISTGTINNQNVICVSEDSGNCKSGGLLITLQHNDNPEQVMRDLFNLAARKSGGGITRVGTRGHSLKETIDIDRYLAESPVAKDLDTSNSSTNMNDTPETPTEKDLVEDSDVTNQNQDDNSQGEKVIIENPFEDL